MTSSSRSRVVAAVTAATARSNASSLAFDGLVEPLTLRTYCRAASCASSRWRAARSCGGCGCFDTCPKRYRDGRAFPRRGRTRRLIGLPCDGAIGRVAGVLFRQVTHDDLGCASYLIGDEDAGVAAVVDPKLDIEEYLSLARYLGVSIEHVLETHTHADHVSGHGRLAAATGATIHIHRAAAPGLRARAVRRRLGARARRAARARAAHAGPPAGAHGVPAARHGARRRRALGRALGRQPVRRRRRAARPGDRPRGRRARRLQVAARQAALAPRRGGAVAGAPRRLDVRRARHGPQGLLDDRLRARATTPR